MTVTVIHGPMASGKTRNAERFRTHYGCRRIVDGWEVHHPAKAVTDGDLVLTNEPPEAIRWRLTHAKIISIDVALRAIGEGTVQ